ncbi:MAG: acyl-ACP--UDP-N-acetylglucosamine O-acyltransferase [Bacteroidales bacterium]|nr:acyl-ACP--UDP-N-acetylglucosamine O-acyltransferase [Bacteroidales bacterium]
MISPLASVHPHARIAENVTIEPFATISEDVEIGEGTWVGPNSVIMDGARIGKNCKIFPGAVISAIPQDLKYRGEKTLVEIGDSTTLRECVTVNKGTAAIGTTIIGGHCLIMAYSHVAHDCKLGNHVIMANATGLAGEITIDDYAYLGGMVGVHQFVHIGAHTMIQAGSRIGQDIPPYVTAGRHPVRYEGINVIGLRRRGFSEETIETIHEVYRYLYQKKLNVSQAFNAIEKELPATPERDEILHFIRHSKRGIIR